MTLKSKKQSPSRTVFIGDVHGCLDELLELIAKINVLMRDIAPHKIKILFLGDLIGKGPHPKEVIEWVHHHHHISLLGNHEWSYLMALKDFPDQRTTRYQLKKHLIPTSKNTPPAVNSLPHYQALKASLGAEGHNFIKSFPLYIDEENFIAVHGGFHPHFSLAECPPEFIVNVRTIDNKPWHHYYTGKKTVFYGHWAAQGLLIKKNAIGLDSGCVYGGKLSAYVLETKTLIQVKARRRYVAI
ncbi:bis(5'-nucleosyl)-tetraphosphatase [Spirochaetota bacterium]|nr:bis(5'-nucleosyl)-tetraphosphatase [Spirochaetota bacterium]